MKQTDMIAAISTPIGRGAISIVRMSGNGVLRLASEMFSPFPASPSLLKLGTLDAGGGDVRLFQGAEVIYRRGHG